MVVGLLGNESPDLNRFILVNPKSENDVRLQATIGNQNPTGLPVGAVSQKLQFAKAAGEVVKLKAGDGCLLVLHMLALQPGLKSTYFGRRALHLVVL